MSTLEYLNTALKERARFDSRKPAPHPLLSVILDRKARNRDTRIIIQGEAGVGKSWLALRLAELVDPAFRDNPVEAVENQVFYTAVEFLKAVTTLPQGSVLLYDEPAQSFHHREFMKESNIILSKTIISFRFRQFISLFCIPTLAMVDRDARSLSAFMINVLEHGKSEVYRVNVRKFGGDPYYQKMIDAMDSKPPSVKLKNAYEVKKRETEDKIYEEYFKVLSEKDQEVKLTNKEMLSAITQKPENYSKNDRVSPSMIMVKFNIGRARADALTAGALEALDNQG